MHTAHLHVVHVDEVVRAAGCHVRARGDEALYAALYGGSMSEGRGVYQSEGRCICESACASP